MARSQQAREVARVRAKVKKALRMPVDPSRTVAGLTMRAIEELLCTTSESGALKVLRTLGEPPPSPPTHVETPPDLVSMVPAASLCPFL